MKKLFRAIAFLAMGLLLVACGQSVTVTPSPIPIPSASVTITLSPVPSQTATATIESTPRPEYVPPTLIPTIDPTLLPDLLNKVLSIQILENVNGFKTQRITGWDIGFVEGICSTYNWLDANHLLIHPVSGQDRWGEAGPVFNIASQPVVINVDTENLWIPPSNQSESPSNCGRLNWSSNLKILITRESHEDASMVSTYTYEGKQLASYPGELLSISPSRTKILMKDGTMLDLQTNKKINLNWNLENYEAPVPLVSIYWTADETRLYQCCYFYADLVNGKSFRFAESDFLDSQGNQLDYAGLWMYRGEWVLDDTFFLVWWSYLDDGDMRYLPMFDPAEKVLYDVRKIAGISPDLTCYETDTSPDGKYLWIMCYEVNYLIDLSNFETTSYPGYTQVNVYWSKDSRFAWLTNYNYNTSENNIEILSIANKGLKPLPVAPLPESDILWHSTDNVLVYPAKDKKALIFLDVSTMTYQELSFKDQDSQSKISNLAWSPNSDKLIFTMDGRILWQVDYPALENLEQIITSTNTIGGAQWSPDGKSIAFINGPDIYIVDTVK